MAAKQFSSLLINKFLREQQNKRQGCFSGCKRSLSVKILNVYLNHILFNLRRTDGGLQKVFKDLQIAEKEIIFHSNSKVPFQTLRQPFYHYICWYYMYSISSSFKVLKKVIKTFMIILRKTANRLFIRLLCNKFFNALFVYWPLSHSLH